MGGGFGDWIIGVYLKFSTDGPMTMTRLSAASQAANAQLLKQQGLIDANTAAMLRYQRQIESVQMRQRRFSTHVFGGIALGGLALTIAGLDQASQLQKAMVSVGIATNTTDAKMRQFYEMAVHMSGITAQSVATIGQEMAMAATSGLTSQQALLHAFPEIAKAADVLWIGKGADPVQSVRQLTQLVHLYGHYQGPLFENMLQNAVRMMFVQPEGLQALANQSRYFVPMARSAGISQDDIFGISAAMGLTGFLRGRGGTGAARTIQYMLGADSPLGLSGRQEQALSDLHLTTPSGALKGEFEDKKGNLILSQVLSFLEHERHTFKPGDFTNDLMRAFLQQGGTFLSALLMPTTYAKYQQTMGRMHHMGTIDDMWQRYSNTLSFAVPQFVTNFKNVLGAIFLPALPTATTWLKKMAGTMGTWTDALMHNQKLAGKLALGIVTFTAWAAARWAVEMGQMWAAAKTFLTNMNIFTADVLSNARALRYGAPLPGGGPSGVVGAAEGDGESVLARTEKVGVIGMIASWLDNVLTGGMGKGLIKQGAKFALFATERWLLPALNFVEKWGQGGAKFANYIRTFAAGTDDLVVGASRLVGGLGYLLDGIFSIAGKLSPLAFFLQGVGILPGGTMGHTATEKEEEAGLRAFAARRHATAGRSGGDVHFHIKSVQFNMPRGTSQAQARAAFQHLLNLTGSVSTSASLPSALTVGGAAFGSSR